MTISIAEKLAEAYAGHLTWIDQDPRSEPSISTILTELKSMMEDIESEAISEYLDSIKYPDEGHYNHDAHWPSSYGV